jgi:hypothetical protein
MAFRTVSLAADSRAHLGGGHLDGDPPEVAGEPSLKFELVARLLRASHRSKALPR